MGIGNLSQCADECQPLRNEFVLFFTMSLGVFRNVFQLAELRTILSCKNVAIWLQLSAVTIMLNLAKMAGIQAWNEGGASPFCTPTKKAPSGPSTGLRSARFSAWIDWFTDDSVKSPGTVRPTTF
jgi:hypothetical protein